TSAATARSRNASCAVGDRCRASPTRSLTPLQRPRTPTVSDQYNTTRIQKRLGYLSPIEYEEKHYANQAATERANLNTHQPITT
ncbi:IS3 family transposase, partial [Streptomyces lavendulae]|uniref:IS3 family transposase n=1 Tax=Streptomyces lavendulae TaxID=1914 RepID=UPI0032DBC2B6